MANPPRIDINCLMTDDEISKLVELVKSVAHERMRVLEIGTGQGGSALRIYGAIPEDSQIFTIDIKPCSELATLRERFPEINFMIGRSEDFLKILNPLMAFDLIFIDGSHLYEDVLSDLQLSLPLVKQGGIICGHDCDRKYTECSVEMQKDIDAHIHDNKCGFCHAGVTKALYDVFQDKFERHSSTRVWYIKQN